MAASLRCEGGFIFSTPDLDKHTSARVDLRGFSGRVRAIPEWWIRQGNERKGGETQSEKSKAREPQITQIEH
jgi:hypothetical protein